MSGKGVFVAPIHGLACPDIMGGRGFEIENGVYLSNDSDYYDRMVRRHFGSTKEFKSRVYGQELLLEGLGKRPFIHTDWTDENLEHVGEAFSSVWPHFNQALWLLRDNSAFFHRSAGSISLANGRTHSWRASVFEVCFNASGAQDTTSYSLDDLRQARKYSARIDQLSLGLGEATSERGGVLLVKAHRLVRAKFFLMSARHQGILPLRIAQYVTCLEALLTTDQAELKHRLCERAALLLEDDGTKQAAVYDALSLAYSVRSAVVHGDRVKRNTIHVTDVSRKCDDVIRRVFRRILEDANLCELFDERSSNGETLEGYFKRLLFHGRQ